MTKIVAVRKTKTPTWMPQSYGFKHVVNPSWGDNPGDTST